MKTGDLLRNTKWSNFYDCEMIDKRFSFDLEKSVVDV